MSKKLFLSSVLFPVLILLASGSVFTAPAQKSKTATQQKSGKIVIEYVSFPDVFKQYDVYPWETMNVEDFREAYKEMLGPKRREEWVGSLTGTGDRNRMIHVFSEHILLITGCKPYACDTSQLIVLFSPLSKKCFALSATEGKFEWLGNPDERTKNLLKVLLVEEFREAYKAR
ncbi:MAG TPA: Ivy family c-type lysozyme inhibitor [Syntrophorhabdaceae bacterium]|nr:Ivy family c-type lysozyme inhibitor [Syntrophorhabdaceae bacterium]